MALFSPYRGNFGYLSLLLVLLLPAMIPTASAEDDDVDNRVRYVLNIKVRYFTSPSMLCDHPLLNVTEDPDVSAISWVFPDGTNVYTAADVNPRAYEFSEPNTAAAAANTGPDLSSYNLTALEIDDDQFGHYLCVVEYSNARPAAVIRWGLNVNGADFSELLKEYRENAIVGGAAAGALLLLIGGGCLFWYFCYRDDDEDMDKFDDVVVINPQPGTVEMKDIGSQGKGAQMYNNGAYMGEGSEPSSGSVVDVHM